MFGNYGTDYIDGGAGSDTISYALSILKVTVDLDAGTTTGEGPDTLVDIENVKGSWGADTITGDSNANVLDGFLGNDEIHGGGGDDTLIGGSGDDELYGDDGLDTLYGDAGADTFMFEATEAFNDVDVVKDFEISTDDDVLDISDILDTTSYNHGVDTLTDWVELTDRGSDTVVKVDRDGTGGTSSMEQIAMLEGITGLTDESSLVTSGNLVVA